MYSRTVGKYVSFFPLVMQLVESQAMAFPVSWYLNVVLNLMTKSEKVTMMMVILEMAFC